MACTYPVFMFLIFTMFILNPISGQDDPCQTTTRLPDEDKRPQDATGEGSLCDQLLPKAWYRVDHDLASTCPPGGHCGTVHPAWLDGNVPSEAEGIVNKTVCIRDLIGCCSQNVNIRVKNCGVYRVYELPPLPTSCPAAYCTGVPSPSTTLSTTTPTTATTTVTSSSSTATTNTTTTSASSLPSIVTTNTSSTEYSNETSDFTTLPAPEEKTTASASFSSGVPTTTTKTTSTSTTPTSVSTESTNSQQTGNLGPGAIAAIVVVIVIVVVIFALTAFVCWGRRQNMKNESGSAPVVSYDHLQNDADGSRDHDSGLNPNEGAASAPPNPVHTETDTDIPTTPPPGHHKRLSRTSLDSSDYASLANENTREQSTAAISSPPRCNDSAGYLMMQNNARNSGDSQPDASISMSTPESHRTQSSDYLTPVAGADSSTRKSPDGQNVGDDDSQGRAKSEDGTEKPTVSEVHSTNREIEGTTTGAERPEQTPTTGEAHSSLTQGKEPIENTTREDSQQDGVDQSCESQTQKSSPASKEEKEDHDRSEAQIDGEMRDKATANQSSSQNEKIRNTDQGNEINSSNLEDEPNDGDPTGGTGNAAGLIDEQNCPSPSRRQEVFKILQDRLKSNGAQDETGHRENLNSPSDSRQQKAQKSDDVPDEPESGMTTDLTGNAAGLRDDLNKPPPSWQQERLKSFGLQGRPTSGDAPDETGGTSGLQDDPKFPSDS